MLDCQLLHFLKLKICPYMVAEFFMQVVASELLGPWISDSQAVRKSSTADDTSLVHAYQ